ncbi:MAG: GTP cyclohydrolase I FolE, partial [Brevundimonas sp.]
LTQDIAAALESQLAPLGVAVLVDAEHQCMTTRGVHHRHVSTITTRFTGAFKSDPALMDRFLKLAGKS